jgi:hypothetical protein
MIRTGDIYRIKMYRDDGIKPKGVDTYREKYIIIIGHDGMNLYGAVSTNTKDHHLVPIEFQYPLNHDGYKCYVNCYSLHQVSASRLIEECYKGRISADDLGFIVGCVKNSPLIPEKMLKKFGLLTSSMRHPEQSQLRESRVFEEKNIFV